MTLLQLLPLGAVLETLLAYKWVILFYAAVIGVIYFFRDKFDWQAKFIGLYRTKVGLKLMNRLGKHTRLFRFLGDVGIFVGFAGMLFIMGMLGKGLYDLLFVPNAPPVISPVFPGVPIPGLGIKVPLIIGWLALFLVIVIHEFSHGVVARAHGIKVKSSGLMVFGPLGGAFVEPDEKQMRKQPKRTQLAIFAAGPFSNLLSALLFILLLVLVTGPVLNSFIASDGVLFDQVQPGYPAAAAGVQPGVVYDSVNGQPISSIKDFYAALDGLIPGERVTLTSSSGLTSTFEAAERPDNSSQGYLGVVLGENLKNPSMYWLFATVGWFSKVIMWAFILSLGIGLANLLPLGPVDGGRMFQVASEHFFGEKKGKYIWVKVSIFLIILLVVLLVIPIIKSF